MMNSFKKHPFVKLPQGMQQALSVALLALLVGLTQPVWAADTENTENAETAPATEAADKATDATPEADAGEPAEQPEVTEADTSSESAETESAATETEAAQTAEPATTESETTASTPEPETETTAAATEDTTEDATDLSEADRAIQKNVVSDAYKLIDDAESRESLDVELQQLKQDILETNKDLVILEEDLLFPSSTQVKVFFSTDVGEYFTLNSVTIKLNDEPVAHHLYTDRELGALERGAVQRLLTDNLTIGEHELVAVITGLGPKGRDYRRAVAYTFEKATGTKYLHLNIHADSLKQQPEFDFKEWE